MMPRHRVRGEVRTLRLWHAWVLGGFVVAYLTADDDTYALHLFAGYAVLAALAARWIAGLVVPPGSPLELPRVRAAQSRRSPVFGWFAVALMISLGAAAITGVFADVLIWMEDPHEVVAELSLWVIGGHVAFILFMYGGKRRLLAWIRKGNGQ